MPTAGTTYQILVQGQGSQRGDAERPDNPGDQHDAGQRLPVVPEVLCGPSASILDANVNAT